MRVSLKTGGEDARAFRVGLLFMGFACLWSWIGVNGGLSSHSSISDSRFVETVYPVVVFISLAFGLIMRMFIGPAVIRHLSLRLETALLALVILVGDTLAVLALIADLSGPIVFFSITGVFISSYGVAGLLGICLDALCGLSSWKPLLLICPGFAISASINTGMALLPYPHRTVVLALLPLTAALFLILAVTDQKPAPCAVPRGRFKPATLIALGIGVFTYGFTMMVVWSIVVPMDSPALQNEIIVTRSLGILVAMVFLGAVEILLEKYGRSMLDMSINRTVLIVMLIGISIAALFGSGYPTLSGIVADIGSALFQVLIFSYAIGVCRYMGVPIVRSLGFLLSILLVSQLVARVAYVNVFVTMPQMLSFESVVILCLMVLVPVALIVFVPFDTKRLGDRAAGVETQPAVGDQAVSLARHFGLTPREREVTELLLRGRSLPYIQEKLVISEGTAKTHLRHIYEKTSVHTRQELLDLPESYLFNEEENGAR